MSDSSSPDPDRKRSVLLSPVGIGAMALLGTGAFAATNGFGLGGRSCLTTQVVHSLAQCQAVAAAPLCATAFGSGPAGPVGLSRSSGGTWSHQPLRAAPNGSYLTASGSPFAINASCGGSSSSNRSSSFYYGGYGGSSNTSPGQSSVQRGGFGSTAVGFSSSGS